MNILSVIVLIYLALALARGFIRGFVKTLFSMIFFILVIASTFVLQPTVTSVLAGSEHVTDYVREQSTRLVEEKTGALGNVSDADNPEELALAIVGSTLQLNGVKKIAAEKVSEAVLTALGFCVTLALSMVFWIIIEVILNRIVRRGFIGPVNRLLGLMLSGIKGLIMVWFVFGVIYALQFTSTGSMLVAQIEESPFLSAINRVNILMQYIPNILLSMF